MENVQHLHPATEISDAINAVAEIGNEWETLLAQYEQAKDSCEEKEKKYGALIRYLRQIQGDNNDGFFTEGMIVMSRYIKEIKETCDYISGYRKQLKIKEI
jgi:hypothetical protein